MTTIRLRNHFASDVTMISNEFIDNYMVSANGEYVKIYLYILRLTLDPSRSWTLSTITDKLECTTKDVLRALRHWIKKGLISCEFTEEGELMSVTFLDPESPQIPDPGMAPMPTRSYLSPEPSAVSGSASAKATISFSETDSSEAPAAVPAAASLSAASAAAVPSAVEVPYAAERTGTITLDPERVKKLKRSKDAKLILSCASGLMGHPVTPTESDALMYFFDELHFSTELMEFLLEYCASKEACTLPYIKKVAFAWYDKGIATVAQAQTESANHNRDFYTIMQAYGLGNREPAAAERDYLNKWLNTNAIPMDLILEAVNRTMLQIHEPKFSYTDSILESWKQAGVKNLADVQTQDERHAQTTAANTVRRPSSRPASGGKGFTDHKGRDIDYDALERKLLGY